MDMNFSDNRLSRIAEKVADGIRLTREDGLTLYSSMDVVGIGRIADEVRQRRYGKKAFYICNQHINYTNVCTNRCRFCAYATDEGKKNAYTWSIEEVRARLLEYADHPVQELHIVGGLNQKLDFSYFTDMLKTAKEVRPNATIKAFTAVEIDYLSTLSGLSVSDTIAALKSAGLMMMPGGGAEVMSDRIHQELFPEKIGKDRWLEVTRAVHESGLKTNATMLYGHIETMEERIDHLLTLRALQDDTGGFLAFIPLAFHSQNTTLSDLPPTNAVDDLKTIAISRLMLDNIDHIKAYWVMISEALAQVALSFGADDLDGTIIEERITHRAGATSATGLTQDKMIEMIRSAGFVPVERDSFYAELNTPVS